MEWTARMDAPMRDLRIGGWIVFGSGRRIALCGEMVFALTIEEGMDGAPRPGDVLSARCTLDLVNDAGQWSVGGELFGAQDWSGATLMPELGADGAEGLLWRPLGVFQVESAMRLESENRLRIQASDSVSWELGAAFADTQDYPATLEALWRRIVAQTRYEWSGTVPNGAAVIDFAPDWKQASLRTAMGYAAAAAGCFVRLNRSGSLVLCPLHDAADARRIDGQQYLKLEHGEAVYGPVDALQLKPTGAEETSLYRANAQASGLFSLSISENPLFQAEAPGLEALARGTLEAVCGFVTTGMRFDWRGDPEVEIGRRVAVTDRSGTTWTGVVTRQTMRYEAGFSASCACAAPEEDGSGARRLTTPEGGLNAAALVGAVDGALLSVGSITTNKLAARSITAEKLAAGAIDADALSAYLAKIEQLTADNIQADTLGAELARIQTLIAGTAEFDRATVAHLVAQALNLEYGVGDQVFIHNLAVAYAQMVGATIGELCVKASNGNYYLLDVDASGAVTATQTTLSQGEINAGQTSGGRAILETNMTVTNLSTSNLLGTYALMNRIDAARIDVDTLLARQAFVDLLYTSRIFGGESLEIIAGKVNSIDVGGRNYLRNSQNLRYYQYYLEGSEPIGSFVGSAVVGTARTV